MSKTLHDHPETASERQLTNVVFTPKEVKRSSLIESCIFSVSLATLCFLAPWNMLIRLAADETVKYFETSPPPAGLVVSLVFDVVVLAGLILLLLTVRDRVHVLKRPSEAVLALLGVTALYQCEDLLRLWFTSGSSQAGPEAPSYTGWEITVTGCLLLTSLWSRRFLAIGKRIVFILSPLCLVLVANSVWFYSSPDLALLGSYRVAGKLPDNSSKTSTEKKRRVVWIIFDEMDYYLGFEGRPSRLKMPEFDRLRQESLFGERVSAPAGYTLLSMPSFLTGRRVVQVKIRTNDLRLQFENSSDWASFASSPDLFRTARNAGFNTAIAGWYHPYCRVLANDLADCVSVSNDPEIVGSVREVSPWSFWKRAFFLVLWDVSKLPLHSIRDFITPSRTLEHFSLTKSNALASRRLPHWMQQIFNMKRQVRREQHIKSAKLITANAVRMLNDPDLNLVMIHLPVPHPEGIWNTERQQFAGEEPSDYIDNLALADDLLGSIRRALENKGDWDRTAIVISADHPMRVTLWKSVSLWNPEMESLTRGKDLKYVPFFLKLPGQHSPRTIQQPFNNVVSAGLIIRILNGQIADPHQAISYLGQ